MHWLPSITFSWRNALLLALPLIYVRLVLLRRLNPDAANRADLFPPWQGWEEPAMQIYFVTSILLYLTLPLLVLQPRSALFWPGLLVYGMGLVGYTWTILTFARPVALGLLRTGPYAISRHPMYTFYFFYFLGIALATASWSYLLLLIVFQIVSHALVLSEERWCEAEFGDEYRAYRGKVSRYLGRRL